MSAAKHTPGPWIVGPHRYVDASDELPVARVEVILRRDPTNPDGSLGSYMERHDEMTANARLIAAAPDLLAACEMALALIKATWGRVSVDAIDDEVCEEHDKLEAAIAKAKGGTT